MHVDVDVSGMVSGFVITVGDLGSRTDHPPLALIRLGHFEEILFHSMEVLRLYPSTYLSKNDH